MTPNCGTKCQKFGSAYQGTSFCERCARSTTSACRTRLYAMTDRHLGTYKGTETNACVRLPTAIGHRHLVRLYRDTRVPNASPARSARPRPRVCNFSPLEPGGLRDGGHVIHRNVSSRFFRFFRHEFNI